MRLLKQSDSDLRSHQRETEMERERNWCTIAERLLSWLSYRHTAGAQRWRLFVPTEYTNSPVSSFVFMSRGSDSPHVRSELISFSRAVSLDSIFLVHNYLVYFLAAHFCCLTLLTEDILELFLLFPLFSVSASPFGWCWCFGSCFVIRPSQQTHLNHVCVQQCGRRKVKRETEEESRCVRAQRQWGDG